MTDFFSLLFFMMVMASIWGGIVLAKKWAKGTVARVFLALLLIPVLIVVAATAVMAGCSALGGKVDFR